MVTRISKRISKWQPEYQTGLKLHFKWLHLHFNDKEYFVMSFPTTLVRFNITFATITEYQMVTRISKRISKWQTEYQTGLKLHFKSIHFHFKWWRTLYIYICYFQLIWVGFTSLPTLQKKFLLFRIHFILVFPKHSPENVGKKFLKRPWRPSHKVFCKYFQKH